MNQFVDNWDLISRHEYELIKSTQDVYKCTWEEAVDKTNEIREKLDKQFGKMSLIQLFNYFDKPESDE